MRMGRTALLAIVAMGLASLDWLLWTTPLDVSPRPAGIETAVASGERRAAATERPPPQLDQLAEILSRPLFAEGRRPPAGEPAVATDRTASGVLLAGVMLSDVGRRALLMAGEGEKAEWVEEGGDFAGWNVAEIETSGVTLVSGGARVAVALRRTETPPAAGSGAQSQ